MVQTIDELPSALLRTLQGNLSTLMWLDLSFNKLSVVDFALLKAFPSLAVLNLDNNRIVAVRAIVCHWITDEVVLAARGLASRCRSDFMPPPVA